jgi:hypothetical protein
MYVRHPILTCRLYMEVVKMCLKNIRSIPCIPFSASNGSHSGHKHFQGTVVTFPSDCKLLLV